MKAVGYRASLPIEAPESLLDLELPEPPEPAARDLLVRVRAVSVNPIDTKVRKRTDPNGDVKILGWDCAGTVEAVGAEAEFFRPGDAVFYAGVVDRPGTNAELHLVDERVVGRKPASLSFAEAAAMPLTGVTAWELLFDRLGARRDGDEGEALLIVGGAGGVGSMLTQLARRLTKLTVIATASRPATRDWALAMGAHHVVDHSRPLEEQVKPLAPRGVRYAAALTHSAEHFAALAALSAPQGRIGLIDDPASPLDVTLLKGKSVSLHWESMFTRSLFKTPDMIAQREALEAIAALVDDGALRTTLRETLGPIDAATLRRGHALIEGGATIGKLVLEGF